MLVIAYVARVSHAVPASELAALLDLYNATTLAQYGNVTKWLMGDPCTNGWYGVHCDGFGTTVEYVLSLSWFTRRCHPVRALRCRALLFSGIALEGTIPSSISALTNLQ